MLSSVPPRLRKETAQRGHSASLRPQSCLEPEPGLKRLGPFTWRLAFFWGPDSRNWSGNLASLRPPDGTPGAPGSSLPRIQDWCPSPTQATGLKEWAGVRKGLGHIFPPFPGPRCLSPCCQRGNKLCVSCRNETCSAEQMVLICSELHGPASRSAWRAAAAAAPELTAAN